MYNSDNLTVTAQEIISQSLSEDFYNITGNAYNFSSSFSCCCCGKENNIGYRLKNVFSDSYGEYNTLRNPCSDYMCINCAFSIKYVSQKYKKSFNFPVIAWGHLYNGVASFRAYRSDEIGNKKDEILNIIKTPSVGLFFIASMNSTLRQEKKHFLHFATVNYISRLSKKYIMTQYNQQVEVDIEFLNDYFDMQTIIRKKDINYYNIRPKKISQQLGDVFACIDKLGIDNVINNINIIELVNAIRNRKQTEVN